MTKVTLTDYEVSIIKLALRKAIENGKTDDAVDAYKYVLINFEYKTTGE